MQFDRTGIILYVIEYSKCITFYEKILGLSKLFEKDNLCCFEFGGSYLMIELDDESNKIYTKAERTKTCLRMNVPNVKKIANKLIAQNVEVDYQEHSWGTIAKFHDPDGNLLAFKDSEKFETQVKGF